MADAIGTASATQQLNNSNPTRNVSLLLHGNGADGSTAFVDSSPSPKTLTVFVGTPTLSTAQSMFGGSSILLPTTSASIAIPAAAFQYAVGAQFTIEFFIRLVSLPTGEGTVIALGAPGAGASAQARGGWDVSIPSNGAIKFSVGSTATNTFNVATTTGVLTAGAWSHVSVNVNGSTAPRITIGGATQPLTFYSALSWAAVAPNEANAPSVLIGQYWASGTQDKLNAYINELRITSNAVVYTADFAPPTSAFVNVVGTSGGTFVGGTGASTQALNTSAVTGSVYPPAIATASSTQKPNSQAGLGGDPYFANVGLLLHGDTPGALVDSSGSARAVSGPNPTTGPSRFSTSSMLFDGVGGGVIKPADGPEFVLGSSDYTVEVWVNPSSIPGTSYGGLVSRAGFGYGWYLHLHAGAVHFSWSTAGTAAPNDALGPVAPTINSWTHVAAVRSGPTVTVYVGGVAGTPVPATAIFGAGETLVLGTITPAFNQDYFNGRLEEVRITKGTARYTANFTPLPFAFPNGPIPSPDPATVPGSVAITGTAGSTQGLNTSLASNIAVSNGIVASTQGLNTATITAAVASSGTSASTQAVNRTSVAGTVTTVGIGTAASTQAPNTVTLTAAAPVASTAASTQAFNAGAATSTSAVATTTASTQALNVSNASAAIAIAGAAASTQTLNASAAASVTAAAGTAASTQALNTSVAVVATVFAGTAASVQKGNTPSAAAATALTGGAASTQALNTSSATSVTNFTMTAASVQTLNTTAAFATAIVVANAAVVQNPNSQMAATATTLAGAASSVQQLNTAAATSVAVAISVGAAASTQAPNAGAAYSIGVITCASASTQAKNTSAVVGTPVAAFTRSIPLTGVAPGDIGTALIQLTPHPAGIAPGSFGTQSVSLFIRTIPGVGAISQSAFGSSTTWFRVRSVAPVPITYAFSSQQFGNASVADPRRYLVLTGMPPGSFGALTAARNERAVYPAPITGAMGLPTLRLQFRITAALSVNDGVFGVGAAYNSRQYAVERADLTSVLLGAVGVPGIENRNRLVHAYGGFPPRLSTGAVVENRARVLGVPGTDTSIFGTALAAYRIRTVYVQGTDSSYITNWHAAYIMLHVVGPSGIGKGSAGVPYVWSDNQRIDLNGASTQPTAFGATTATFRIRTVALSRFDGIAPGPFGSPNPHLNTRYITPSGFTGGFGATDVAVHRNIIAPHGADWSLYGTATLVNKTHVIGAGPWLDENAGRPHIELFRRTVDAAGQGASDGVFGKPYIGPRTRYIAPNGVLVTRFSSFHDVHIDAPQIPARQLVIVTDATGGKDSARYGVSTAYNGGLMPSGFTQLQFGVPSTTANSITGATILLDQGRQFGVPSLNSVQVAKVGTFSNMGIVGRPRIDPYHVYISEDSTGSKVLDEAIMDYVLDKDPTHRPFFGTPAVTNRNRGIFPYPVDDGTVSFNVSATARIRTLAPPGFKGKIGYPHAYGGILTIAPYWGFFPDAIGDFDAAMYGDTLVTPAPDLPGAAPNGINPGGLGNPGVDFFNRTIYPASFYTTIFTGDTHIGPPVPIAPAGIAPPSFDTATWASLWVRQVLTPGIAPSGFDYVPGSMNFDTLVVRLKLPPIQPVGAGSGPFPPPTIVLGRLGATLGMGILTAFGRPRIGDCATC